MFKILKKIQQRELYDQIRQYTNSKSKFTTHKEHIYWLNQFAEMIEAKHVIEIKEEDIDNFFKLIAKRESSKFRLNTAMMSVCCFLKYCKARRIILEIPTDQCEKIGVCDTMPDMKKMFKYGRPIDLKMVEKVIELRKKGNSLREIKAILESKTKKPQYIASICRWSRMGNLVSK